MHRAGQRYQYWRRHDRTVNAVKDERRLFVVVPFYNEERGIAATLQALVDQVDRSFSLVLVNNASTDGGAELAREFSQKNNSFPVHLLHEPAKGTGTASDTGFRFAIEKGARWIARTDADCTPDRDWTQNLMVALRDEGLEFVAGKILPREDEVPLTLRWRMTLAVTLWVAESYGKINIRRRGAQFRYPYFMAAGNNLAISASLYERSGGFPRSTLEDLNEDLVLSEAVRTLTTRAAKRNDVIVRNSTRRVRSYGIWNTLRWYRNRAYKPKVVDIR